MLLSTDRLFNKLSKLLAILVAASVIAKMRVFRLAALLKNTETVPVVGIATEENSFMVSELFGN